MRVSGLPDAGKRLLVTLLAIALFRMGQSLPVPGVDSSALESAVKAEMPDGPLYGLADLLTGGGLLTLSVLALGIVPFIAADFLMGILGLLIPRLRVLMEAGTADHARVARYTRVLAVLLAAVQGTVLVTMVAGGRLPLGGQGDVDVLHDTGALAKCTMVVCMTAGTAVVIWLSGLITAHGFGEGLSVLFFAQVAAVFPGQVWAGSDFAHVLVVAVAIVLVTVVAITVQQAARHIPTQQAKRMVGRSIYGGAAYLPVGGGQVGFLVMTLASLMLFLPAPATSWCLTAYVLLVVSYAFFRTSIDLDASGVADELKREGRFVPGIRPGRPTAEYIAYVQLRIGLAAALCKGVVALIPMAALAALGPDTDRFTFSATTLLIVASLAMATAQPIARQVDSQLARVAYEPYLMSGGATGRDGEPS